MRKRTIGILLIVFVVLLPTWFAAVQSVEQVEKVDIDSAETDMRPLQSIIDTPQAFTPAQVGVVIWLALGAQLVLLVVIHRVMEQMVRPSGGSGGTVDGSVPDWFQTENWWVAEYVSTAEGNKGLWIILALSLLTIVLAGFMIREFFTLARTQYFGLYLGGIFLAIAGMTAAYYAWFLPHVHVAEERYHD